MEKFRYQCNLINATSQNSTTKYLDNLDIKLESDVFRGFSNQRSVDCETSNLVAH